MQDIAPPKPPHPAPEPASHTEARPHPLRRAHDRMWARLWHCLDGDARHKAIRWVLWPIRALVFTLDLPFRWLASIGDLLVHWWIGFLGALRRENGYITAGSIVAVYFAVFGLIDNKSTQEETRASVERSLFMSMVTSGSASSFVVAMKTFGPVQTMEVTLHPDLFQISTWGRTYRPNREPRSDWARVRLGACKPNECSLDAKTRIDLRNADLDRADLMLADLGGADLRNASLILADLVGGSLRNADLRGAFLVGADLGRADLGGAHLGGTEHLGGANLFGADLRDVDLRGADLRGAQYDGDTKFPDGFDPKAAGMELVPRW